MKNNYFNFLSSVHLPLWMRYLCATIALLLCFSTGQAWAAADYDSSDWDSEAVSSVLGTHGSITISGLLGSAGNVSGHYYLPISNNLKNSDNPWNGYLGIASTNQIDSVEILYCPNGKNQTSIAWAAWGEDVTPNQYTLGHGVTSGTISSKAWDSRVWEKINLSAISAYTVYFSRSIREFREIGETSNISNFGAGQTINVLGIRVWLHPSTPATTYTVTYKANGSGESDEVDDEATEIADNMFTYSGKTFMGWNTADDGTGDSYEPGDEVEEDLTLYAQWENTYTVTYDKNGGTGSMDATENEIVACTFTAPSGKGFKEWNTAANGSGTAYAVGATVTSDLDLYAIWQKVPTTVFQWAKSGNNGFSEDNTNLNAEGQGSMTVGTSVAGRKLGTNNSDNNTKGYRLGNNDVCIEIQGTSNFEAGDTVIVTGVGGGSGARSFAVAPSSTTDAVADTVLTDAKDNSSTASEYKVVIKAAQAGAKIRVFRKAGSTMYISAIKVRRPIQYTVSYALNGGTGTTPTESDKSPYVTFTLHNGTTGITAPDGKEFDKWNDGTTDYAAGATYTMPASNVTLTAQWKAALSHYTITYSKGANGTGTIAAGDKTEGVAFDLTEDMFTRDGYVQTGWATSDGGSKVYDLGGSYTTDADIELFPVWTEKGTDVASFSYAGGTPSGWTFSNAGFDADSKATAAYVGAFTANSLTAPGNNGMEEDWVAFAKNASAVATYDLGYATTVSALSVTLYGGSSSAFNQTIEYVGADGSTVKQTYTNSLSAGNWASNSISKTDVVPNVRYIKIYGASKWVVMSAFSVTYGDMSTKYTVTYALNGGTGTTPTETAKKAGATFTLHDGTTGITPPSGKTFSKWKDQDATEYSAGATYTMPTKNVTLTAQWLSGYSVTFNMQGHGDAIAAGAVSIGDAAEEPEAPTASGYSFHGWYEEAGCENEWDFSTVLTGNITLYAKWLSTDATLSDLKVDGTTITGFASGTTIYKFEVPYGTAVADMPKITAATCNNANATYTIYPADEPVWNESYNCYLQQVEVTPEDNTAAHGYYHVRITVAPKLGAEMIRMDVPGGTVADVTVTGFIGGTGKAKTQDSKKLGSNGHYIGFTLAGGNTFAAGDLIWLNVSATNGASKLYLYSDIGETSLVTLDVTLKEGNNYIALPAEAVGQSSLYLYRVDSKMNPTVLTYAVLREQDPFIQSFTIAGIDDLTIDPSAKTISATVAADFDLSSLTPTVTAYANGGATVTPAGAQDFSTPVTYTVTSAYSETTDYTVNIFKQARTIDEANVGSFGTFCSAKNVVAFRGASFFELGGGLGETEHPYMLIFNEVDHLVAGMPYIFISESTSLDVVYGDEVADAAGHYNGFYGTLENITASADNVLVGKFLMVRGTIKKCGINCSLAAGRGYFDIDEVPCFSTKEECYANAGAEGTPNPAPRRRVTLNNADANQATAIEYLTEDGVVAGHADGCYDVLGRKIAEPQQGGVYIINGKKVVVVK